MSNELQLLRNELNKIDSQIQWEEDTQGFTSRALKNQYWTLRDTIEKIEKIEQKSK
jgi:hypothetical protein